MGEQSEGNVDSHPSSPPIGWALTQRVPPGHDAGGGPIDSGTMYGSFVGLALVLVTPVVLVAGLLSAAGAFPLIVPISLGIGMLIFTAIFRSSFALTVKNDCLEMTQFQNNWVWYWQNVDHVEPHRLGAKLVFKTPVSTGRMTIQEVRFAYFDPQWRDRPVMQTVTRRVALEKLNGEVASGSG